MLPFEAVARDVQYAVRGFRRAPLASVTIVATVPLGPLLSVLCSVPACALAAWLPAWRAGRIEPIATLRHD